MAYDGTLKFDTKIDTDGISKGLQTMKNVALAGAAAIGAGIGAAISKGMDFEEAMSSVKAISGASQEEFEALSAAAKEMGETTKFSATESANALEYLSLAGYSAQESIEALPKVLNLAAAGGMDLAYASDLLTDSMAVMGLGIENMDNFSDQLAMAASKSNTSVQQLGEAVLVAGGQAKLAGMSVDEMNTALGILADNGIKGSEGGTALRNTLKNLYTPTNQAAKELEALGVATAYADGRMRPVQDVLQDLGNALDGLTEADRMSAMSTIFDTRTIAAANALLENSGERFDELQGYLLDCDGAAKEMADTMNDNLKGSLTLLGSAAEGLGIQFYESLQGPLKEAVDAASEEISKLTRAMRDGALSGAVQGIGQLFGTLVTVLVKVASVVIPPVVRVLGLLGSSLKVTLPLITAFIAAWKGYNAVLAVSKAIDGFRKASVLANVALNAHKITLTGANAATLTATAAKTAEAAAEAGATGAKLAGTAATITETEVTAASTGAIGLKTLAVGVLSGQITIATAVQEAWNLVMMANPIGLVIAAVAALVVGIVALCSWLNKEAEEDEAVLEKRRGLIEETDTLIQKTNDLTSSIQQNNEAYEQSSEKSESEAKMCRDLTDELFQLNGVQDKTFEQKARIAAIVDILNEKIDGLNLTYDEESDTLEGLNEDIYDNIAALEAQAKAKAARTLLENGYEQQFTAQKDMEAALQKAKELQTEMQSFTEGWTTFEKNAFADITTAIQDGFYAGEDGAKRLEGALKQFGGSLTESEKEVFETYRQLQEGIGSIEDAYAEASAQIEFASGQIAASQTESGTQVMTSVQEMSAAVKSAFGADFPTSLEGAKAALQDMYNQMIASGEYSAEFMAAFKANIDNGTIGACSSLDDFLAKVEATMGSSNLPSEAEVVASKAVHAFITAGQVNATQAAANFTAFGNAINQGLANGMSQDDAVVSAASEVFKIPEDEARSILGIHSPSTVMMQLGGFVSQGLALGINAGKSQVIQAAIEVMRAAVIAAKNEGKIESPSHVWRDEIGVYLSEGMALGIMDGKRDVVSAVKRVASAALETGKQKVRFSRDDVGKTYVDGVAVGIIDNEYKVNDATKAMFDNLDLQRDLDIISEAEYYRQIEALRDQYIKKGTKEWWDYTKKLVEYEKDQMEDLKKSIVDTYSDIADAAIDVIDEVQKKQDKLAEKLASFGADALFQTETHTYKGMGHGTIWHDEAKAWYNEEDLVITKTWLSDFQKENEQLEEYNEILSSIREKLPQMFGGTYDKGVEEALGRFLDMDIAQAIQYGNLLLDATDEELAAHIAGLDGIMRKSKEVAEDTYAPEMENVVAEWKTELEKFYSEVPEEFKDNGKLCAEKFGESFIEEFQNVISDALNVVSGFSISILPSLSGTTGEVIYNNATYNITAGGTSPHDIIEAGRKAQERDRLLGK